MKKNNPIKSHIPFWSMEVPTVCFTPAHTDTGYAISTEHAHQHYEMNFCYSHASIRHTVSGKITDTTTPFFSFRAPLVLHSVRTLDDRPYTRSNVYFHPGMLKKYENICSLGKLSNVRACTIPTDEKQMEYLDKLIEHMGRLWEEDAPENVCVSLLAALLYEVNALVPEDLPPQTETPPYIQEVMLYIVGHIEDNLTLDSLSRQFFISKSKLAQDFHSVTGQSVHDYTTAIRMWRAKSMLTEGMPLSIIADACGFSRDSALITMFRRESGMTPTEWLKSVQ